MERLFVLTGLALASALCLLLELVREVHYAAVDYRFLVWNLVLAWIPLTLALLVYDRYQDGTGLARTAPALALWLLFLPNAPYIVTDVKWLGEYHGGSPVYDAFLIALAALLGLALGFVSIYLVQTVVAARYGRPMGWALAWAALVLSGLGVYLGRFQRWNSWDVFTEPTRVVGQLASAALDPLAHGRPLAWSIAFAVASCTGYALFYAVLGTQLRGLEER